MRVTEPGTGVSRVRIAIVGTGAVAHEHAAAVAAHPGRAELVAVADVDERRAAEFAEQHGVALVATSLADALAADVDLVLLCTPPGSHAPLAVEAVRAGVHALVEKPPALSLAEADGVLAAQEAARGTRPDGSDPQVAVVFQHRFGGGARRLRHLLADGTLGRPLLATCHTEWFRGPDYFTAPWRGRWESEGGGPTFTLGVHQVDLLLSVLGRWSEVSAMAARQARDTATEDVSMAVVRMADGTLVSVVNSVLSPREVSEIRLDTDRATVELTHLYGYSDDDWRLTPAPGHEDLVGRWADGPYAGTATSSHTSQLGDVLEAVQRGSPLPVGLAEARGTLELVAATYASAFTGTVVRAGDIGPGNPFYERMDGTGAPWA